MADHDVCILCHGIMADKHDWDLWVEILLQELPAWHVHPLESISSGTCFGGDPVNVVGEKAAREMLKVIAEHLSQKGILRLHCIGHSMGGLILRAAFPLVLADLSSSGQRSRVHLGHYLSLSTPHLGVQSSWSAPGEAWKNLSCLGALMSEQLPQLAMQDSTNEGVPYLLSISQRDTASMNSLREFHKRTCAALADHDSLIPLPSGVIDPLCTKLSSSSCPNPLSRTAWRFGMRSNFLQDSRFEQHWDNVLSTRANVREKSQSSSFTCLLITGMTQMFGSWLIQESCSFEEAAEWKRKNDDTHSHAIVEISADGKSVRWFYGWLPANGWHKEALEKKVQSMYSNVCGQFEEVIGRDDCFRDKDEFDSQRQFSESCSKKLSITPAVAASTMPDSFTCILIKGMSQSFATCDLKEHCSVEEAAEWKMQNDGAHVRAIIKVSHDGKRAQWFYGWLPVTGWHKEALIEKVYGLFPHVQGQLEDVIGREDCFDAIHDIDLCLGAAETQSKEADTTALPTVTWAASKDGTCRYVKETFEGLNSVEWRRIVVEMNLLHGPLNAHVFLVGKQREQHLQEQLMSRECIECLVQLLKD